MSQGVAPDKSYSTPHSTFYAQESYRATLYPRYLFSIYSSPPDLKMSPIVYASFWHALRRWQS